MLRKCPIYSFFILSILVTTAAAAGFNGTVKKGNNAFKKGDFKAALELYHQAEADRPESPELQYNIGTALYKEGKYEEAADKLEKSFTTGDIDDEAMARYNQGNVFYKMGDYQKAIAAYQKSLELVPQDIDAKYNLELARKMLKEQLKPQQQKNDQQNKPQQQQQQDQQKQEQNQPQQDQQKDQQQEKERQDKSEQVDENKMTREDAERILNALKDDEKQIQKDLKQQQAAAVSQGKDW